MPSFDETFSFSQPTVVLPPSHAFHQPQFNAPQNFSKASFFGKSSPMPSWGFQSPTKAPITKSRKRSRDEAADNLTDDYNDNLASSPVLAPEIEEEWQYGEGMTLIRPNGFIIDASSQTGTWAEEKATEERTEKENSQTQISTERPIIRNAKLQRLDQSVAPSTIDEVVPISAASSPPKSSSGPTVDDFTIHLGIGWSRISEDQHIQAAARGWAKFIENNYPVTSPVIQLESRGLNSYLVEAKEGYFLFGEDLKQGRLVSTNFVKAVQNLQVNPPMFDSNDVLTARSEIVTDEKANNVFDNTTEITNHSVQYDAAPNTMDIDMDMN